MIPMSLAPLLAIALLASVLQFFLTGGFFMLVLVLLSIFALTVIIWRGIALRYAVILPNTVAHAIDALRPSAVPDSVLRVTAQDGSPLGGVIRVMLEHRHWPMAEAREATQARARHEVARMEKGLVFLEITTGVAPLLGLLGTLSGLVSVFANLGDTGDPTLVARGISEALNTTIVGLAVAAPSLIAHNYFVRKVEIMAIEMESYAGELMEKLYAGQSQAGR
jgi:biopolymer transport protein ExbB